MVADGGIVGSKIMRLIPAIFQQKIAGTHDSYRIACLIATNQETPCINVSYLSARLEP